MHLDKQQLYLQPPASGCNWVQRFVWIGRSHMQVPTCHERTVVCELIVWISNTPAFDMDSAKRRDIKQSRQRQLVGRGGRSGEGV